MRETRAARLVVFDMIFSCGLFGRTTCPGVETENDLVCALALFPRDRVQVSCRSEKDLAARQNLCGAANGQKMFDGC